jgi:hypothetical protein
MCGLLERERPSTERQRSIVPGTPMRSLFWLRMNAPLGTNIHMPRIATYQYDTQGMQLVSDWIASIKTCP